MIEEDVEWVGKVLVEVFLMFGWCNNIGLFIWVKFNCSFEVR